MLEGRCPRCGYSRVGWGLQFARHQTCPQCGSALEIFRDGKKVSEGYSPFTAEKYVINKPSDASTPSKKSKEQRP